ncbi:expressed unknown protein [Seminavis robusta]|uniref:Uncharacterized protein n=1 Tax=Seminavis robusta TaxID=568900 RepID=A0A9N8H111_9STRA|nr:expressed unknown protein [Seminavis robusta]|eukprot:Sro9_g007320.1 n/a (721) ;mRNA; r:115490-117652
MPHLVAVDDPRLHKHHPHKHPHEHPLPPPSPRHHHRHNHHQTPPRYEKNHAAGDSKKGAEPIKKTKSPKLPKKPIAKKNTHPGMLCAMPALMGFNFCCCDACSLVPVPNAVKVDDASEQSTISDNENPEKDSGIGAGAGGNPVPVKEKGPAADTWEKFFTDINDNLCGKGLMGGLPPPTIDIATPLSNGTASASMQTFENLHQGADKEELLASRSLLDDVEESLQAAVDQGEKEEEQEVPEALEMEPQEHETVVNETIVIYYSDSGSRNARVDADEAETIFVDEEAEDADDEEPIVKVVLDPVAPSSTAESKDEAALANEDGYRSPCLSTVEGGDSIDARGVPVSPVRFHNLATGSFCDVPPSQNDASSKADPVPSTSEEGKNTVPEAQTADMETPTEDEVLPTNEETEGPAEEFEPDTPNPIRFQNLATGSFDVVPPSQTDASSKADPVTSTSEPTPAKDLEPTTPTEKDAEPEEPVALVDPSSEEAADTFYTPAEEPEPDVESEPEPEVESESEPEPVIEPEAEPETQTTDFEESDDELEKQIEQVGSIAKPAKELGPETPTDEFEEAVETEIIASEAPLTEEMEEDADVDIAAPEAKKVEHFQRMEEVVDSPTETEVIETSISQGDSTSPDPEAEEKKETEEEEIEVDVLAVGSIDDDDDYSVEEQVESEPEEIIKADKLVALKCCVERTSTDAPHEDPQAKPEGGMKIVSLLSGGF